jgi:hypothetical protein
VDDELDGMTVSSSDTVPRTTRVAGVGDDHKVPLFEDGQRGAAALDRVQAAAAPELVEHSDACGHIGLLSEVVGVLGPTAHPGLPLKVFLGVGRCRRL